MKQANRSQERRLARFGKKDDPLIISCEGIGTSVTTPMRNLYKILKIDL